MPRWEPDAVGRLQQAAIELFEQQGMERTTVAEIADRAGLTERTFFNHFNAKSEVLFGPRSERHAQLVVREIAASSEAQLPLDVVVRGLQVAAEQLLEGLRAASTRRRRIIDASPALREREDGKRAALTAAIAGALLDRGVESERALLTARAAVLVEQIAEEKWAQPAEQRSMGELLTEGLVSLRTVIEPQSP